MLLLDQLGLEQFQLHAHRAQFLAQQEIGVAEGEFISGVRGLGGALGPALGEPGFLARAIELAVGQVFVSHC